MEIEKVENGYIVTETKVDDSVDVPAMIGPWNLHEVLNSIYIETHVFNSSEDLVKYLDE